MKNKKMVFVSIMTSCLLAVLALAGCQNKEEAIPDKIRVETTPARKGRLEIHSDYIGTISAGMSVDVMPLAAGTVKDLPVKVGDRVNAGDLLCQLDDTSADLSVKSAEDAVDSAKAGKDAAQTQTDSAKVQAESSVQTLEDTLQGYRDSLDTARDQLAALKDSRASAKEAQAAAKKAYTAAKARVKAAENLLIQFDAFLKEYPDCTTTTGLTAAASALQLAPQAQAAPEADMDLPDVSGQAAGDLAGESSADAAKAGQAQALLTALTQSGLTVEYLTSTGINTLKEDASDAEAAYTAATSGVTQINSSITTLRGNITQLKAQIKATEHNLESAKELLALSSTGSDAYDAQIKAAETGVDAANYQKSLYRITAPISGVIDAVNVKKDGMAAQGYAAFTISSTDSLTSTFYVPEDVRNFLKPGAPVVFVKKGTGTDSQSDQSAYTGHITTIGTAADPQKGLFKVEATLSAPGKKDFTGGTSVRLSLVSNALSGQILIPYDSVYYDNGQAYVYKVIDGKAVRTDIETGLFNEDQIAVPSGLDVGDQIITSWASGLKDGAKVLVLEGAGAADWQE